MSKQRMLTDFAQRVARAATGGYIGRPVGIQQIMTVAGPRAGALHIYAGLDAGRLLKALSANDAAALRQFVPWQFVGNPVAYMHGRAVRVEAGWPVDLAENDIPLGALSPYPRGDGRWVVGMNEHGQTVVTGVNLDRTPHWLVSGATGSGKTVALRSMLVQLAMDEDNHLVIVDGKRGASFRGHGLGAMVGPLATTPDNWRSALLWAANEMMDRYDNGGDGRLIIAIDEVQEIINADKAAAEAIRQLVVMGREASVHCLLATQHPIVKALGGPTVTRNLVGRLALRVADYDASRVAIGGNDPRADYLLGRGDAYAITPTASHRVQVAYTTDKELDAVAGPPLMREWPYIEADALEHIQSAGRPSPWPEPEEMGSAIAAAIKGRGRPWLKDRIEDEGLDRPGSTRAHRILELGRDVHDWLNDNGWQLSKSVSVVDI